MDKYRSLPLCHHCWKALHPVGNTWQSIYNIQSYGNQFVDERHLSVRFIAHLSANPSPPLPLHSWHFAFLTLPFLLICSTFFISAPFLMFVSSLKLHHFRSLYFKLEQDSIYSLYFLINRVQIFWKWRVLWTIDHYGYSKRRWFQEVHNRSLDAVPAVFWMCILRSKVLPARKPFERKIFLIIWLA